MSDDLALLKVTDVAKLWQRSPSFVRRLIAEGKLPVIRLEGDAPLDHHKRGRKDYRISQADALAFITARSTSATAATATTPKVRLPKSGPSTKALPIWDGVRRGKVAKGTG